MKNLIFILLTWAIFIVWVSSAVKNILIFKSQEKGL